MVIEMLFNNKIQISFFQTDFTLLKLNYITVYIVEENLWINFKIFIWTNYQ